MQAEELLDTPGYDRTYSCPLCHYVMGEAKAIYALRQVIAQITDQTIADFAEGADLEGQRLAARLQDIEREIDQIAARRKRLTGAYLDGLIEDTDYRTLIEDQKTAADRLQADRGAIQEKIAARDTDARRSRLQEIKDQGEAAVTGALGDTPACNAWIRTHFLIVTRDSEVEAVIYR